MQKIASLSCVLATVFTVQTGLAQVSTTESTTTTTTSAGTVSQLSPETIMVTTSTSTTPVTYAYTKTTTYVDELGNPVSIETVKSGLPVTVYYSQVGDKMVASKVVVKKAVVVAPVQPVVVPVLEKKTSTTTTTTE